MLFFKFKRRKNAWSILLKYKFPRTMAVWRIFFYKFPTLDSVSISDSGNKINFLPDWRMDFIIFYIYVKLWTFLLDWVWQSDIFYIHRGSLLTVDNSHRWPHSHLSRMGNNGRDCGWGGMMSSDASAYVQHEQIVSNGRSSCNIVIS